jgi:hypothetical protein
MLWGAIPFVLIAAVLPHHPIHVTPSSLLALAYASIPARAGLAAVDVRLAPAEKPAEFPAALHFRRRRRRGASVFASVFASASIRIVTVCFSVFSHCGLC